MIVYDDVKGAWYAHIASEVKLKRDARAPLKCGIDLGQERLVAAVTESGVALLYRGTVLKSDYHFLKTRGSELDKRARFADFDVEVWLEKRKWLFRRFRMRKRELIMNMTAHLAKMLRELGVTEIYIGYPRDIKHDKPTENNNAWPYWQTIKEIARAAENCGIAAYLVPEEGTSRVRARHGCEVQREPRGLVWCPYGHVMHSDINAALNILKRAGGRVPERVKVLSFTPTPKGVIERKRESDAKPIAPQAGRGNGVARAQSPPASALLLNRSSTSSRAPASANARSSPLPFSVLSHDALASTGFGGTFTKTILLPTGSTRSMSPGDTKPLGSFTLPRSSALTRYAIKRRKTSLIPKYKLSPLQGNAPVLRRFFRFKTS